MMVRFLVYFTIMSWVTSFPAHAENELTSNTASLQEWGQSRDVQADSGKGKGLFMKNCSMCHGRNGRSVMPEAPNLSGMNRALISEQQMIISIKQGKGIMPSFQYKLTNEELLNVIAFIRTL